MVNTINELQKRNKQLLEEIEVIKKQLTDKDQEINELKNPGEVSEQEEEEFKQEALVKIDQILVEMRNRFPHCSKNIEQDLRELISKPLRKQFMNVCFQHSLVNNYTIRNEENLEKVIEEIIKKFFEESDLAEELKEKGIVGNQFQVEGEKIPYLIREGGEIWGRPAKDVIIKDIIESKIERIKELETEQANLEAQVEELEERVEIEQEEVQKFHKTSEEWIKRQKAEIVAKHDAREKELLDEIKVLKSNIHWLENKEQTIEKYKDKELPALPKQQKKSRLLKFKQLVSKVKEKTQVKFQTLVIQKSK